MYITFKISEKICTVLTENQIIVPEDNPFYLYCFDFVLDNLFFNTALFLLGVLLGVPLQAAIYIITMVPVKMFAGGAHAGSRIKCSVVSFSVFLSILFLTDQLAAFTATGIVNWIFFLSLFMILIMAPVDTQNKRIPAGQRMQYKQKCLLCCLFTTSVYVVLQYFKYRECYFLVSFCMVAVAFNQTLGMISNAYHKRGGRSC